MSRALALPLLPFAILAGCAHSPASPPAPSDLPLRWEAATAMTAGEMPGMWWSSFGDPVLDALIESGLERNVDLRIAAQRVLASQALRRGATAGLSPEATAEAGVSDASRSSGIAPRGSASVGLGLAWEPDVSGRLSAAVRAARADAGATAADAAAVRLLLIEEVARTYIDYRLQGALAALAARTVAAQEETLRITRDRFEFGMASALDVERAAALVAQTRSEAAVAEEGAGAARFRLAYLLSTTPEAMTARLGSAQAGIPAADPLTVLRSPADILAARPDIDAASARYAGAAARRDGAAALRLPVLSLSGLVGLDAGGIGSLLDGGTSIASVAAGLILPVLDFGRRAAEVDAADARLREAALDYERTVRLALQETQTGILSYLQGQVRERELARAADAARRAADLSQLQYREGTLSQLEVLDAARTVYQAERDHARAAADVSTRLAALYRQMGVAPEATGVAMGGSGAGR